MVNNAPGIVSRPREVEEILNLLSDGEFCLVAAGPRSGKTMLAGEILSAIRKTRPQWTVARVELRQVVDFHCALADIAKALQFPASTAGPPSSSSDAAASLRGTPEQAVLLVDGVDHLPDETLLLLARWLSGNTLEGAPSKPVGLRSCLFAGPWSAQQIVDPCRPHLFRPPDLSKEQTARSMAERLKAEASDESVASTLYNETGGHPHLVDCLAARLTPLQGALSPVGITAAAEAWSQDCASRASLRSDPRDPVFHQAVTAMERDATVLEAVLAALEGGPASPDHLKAAHACGALRIDDGQVRFRGEMLGRALREYMDRLRIADYLCLHGKWQDAEKRYRGLDRAVVQQRRRVGLGQLRGRILDLYLGILPALFGAGSPRNAEDMVAASALEFFGADGARLWWADSTAALVRSTAGDAARHPEEEARAAVLDAVRSKTPLVLNGNKGIVYRIGPGSETWALELLYGAGLPEPWVRTGLQLVEPTLYAALRHVEHVEHVARWKKLYGLTKRLGEMLRSDTLEDLTREIVECANTQFDYARVRFYESNSTATSIHSSRSAGMGDAADDFAAGGFRLTDEGRAGDGFECFRAKGPLVIVQEEFKDQQLPVEEAILDDKGRPVIVIPGSKIQFAKELKKAPETLDVPLGTEGHWVGKLSIDHGEYDPARPPSRFRLEDIELMALFGRCSGLDVERVINLQKARWEVGHLHLLGRDSGLEDATWEFLLQITYGDGPGFNRAVVLLRVPHSRDLRGYLCHGAPNPDAWRTAVGRFPPKTRQDFVTEALARIRVGGLPQDDRDRVARLRDLPVNADDQSDLLSRAARGTTALLVYNADGELRRLYDCLCWAPAKTALLCPLALQGDVEGLLYVDRAFSPQHSLTDSDRDLLPVLSVPLAAALRMGRLIGESQKLRLADEHSVGPLLSASMLASVLLEKHPPGDAARMLELLRANVDKAVHQRQLTITASRAAASGVPPVRETQDVLELLVAHTRAVRTLLEMQGATFRIDVPKETVLASVDPVLIGMVFAELATNAYKAVEREPGPMAEQRLEVGLTVLPDRQDCVVTFVNSGSPVPPEMKSHLFDDHHASRLRSIPGPQKGIGLWLVKEALTAHRATIAYDDDDGRPRFTVKLPILREDTHAADTAC